MRLQESILFVNKVVLYHRVNLASLNFKLPDNLYLKVVHQLGYLFFKNRELSVNQLLHSLGLGLSLDLHRHVEVFKYHVLHLWW